MSMKFGTGGGEIHPTWAAVCSCGYIRATDTPAEAVAAGEVHQLTHEHHGEPAAFRGDGRTLRVGSWSSGRW